VARWFADGTRLLVCGTESDHSQRCYVQDAGGGAPKPVTPLGTHSGSVSPDGTTVLVRRGGGTARSLASSASIDAKFELYPIAGGEPTFVTGLKSDDVVIRWEKDGHSVVVSNGLLPTRVERVDLRSGQRDLIRTIAPTDVPGALNTGGLTIGDDPNVYAYYINQELSRLFLITGAR
jgi:eukaryotic-like serine/threonine-protein kinase